MARPRAPAPEAVAHRFNNSRVTGGRAAMVAGRLTEKDHAIVEVLTRIAKELDSTVARVALAWLRMRDGVTSTLIGARTREHLDDNLQALELKLSTEQVTALDAVSAPQLPFPFALLQGGPAVYAGGTTINGEPSQPSPFSLPDAANTSERGL